MSIKCNKCVHGPSDVCCLFHEYPDCGSFERPKEFAKHERKRKRQDFVCGR